MISVTEDHLFYNALDYTIEYPSLQEIFAKIRGGRQPGPSHPSATSRIIISVKPRAKAIVPMLLCSPSLASGISSSTTT